MTYVVLAYVLLFVMTIGCLIAALVLGGAHRRVMGGRRARNAERERERIARAEQALYPAQRASDQWWREHGAGGAR